MLKKGRRRGNEQGRGCQTRITRSCRRPGPGLERWSVSLRGLRGGKRGGVGAEGPGGLAGLGWWKLWGLGTLPLIVRSLPKLLVGHILG